MTATDEHATPLPMAGIGGIRLIVGLVQGAVLYHLYQSFDAHTWPATDGFVFAPALMVALFVPLIAIQGLGNLRLTTLVAWAIAAAGLLAALAWFDIWQSMPEDWDAGGQVWRPTVVPSAMLFGFASVGLFIAQALIEGGDADRKFIASYHAHFDVAWKLAMQLVLSWAFVGVFWGLLWLGAGLFELIKLDFLTELIQHTWFSIPATTLAFAAAVHVTDVRAGLVRGTRTLALTLLSWLTPLLVVLITGFIAALVVTGLQPLWDTGYAAGLLMFATIMLLLLINATHQDGSEERRPAAILRYAGSIACVAMLPLVVIAGYAIFLRVQQYGWTADRILSATAAALLLFYAGGYAAAAFWPGPWLVRIERWNFHASLVVLAALLALSSPVASPARISVDSQMARLQSGAVAPDKFDYQYLRFEGGRYGRAALQALAASATGPNAALIKQRASAALEQKSRIYGLDVSQEPVAVKIRVHPDGSKLPAGFAEQDWRTDGNVWRLPPCLRHSAECDAVMADFDGDETEDVLLLDFSHASIFKRGTDGTWFMAGSLAFPGNCRNIREAILDGHYEIVAPPAPAWRALTVDGRSVAIQPAPPEGERCPTTD